MILDNPFHVLGLPADCTTRELSRRKSRAEAYLRVRKPLVFEHDICFPAHCQRNAATVKRAIAQLHDGRQRIQHGLFWFTRTGALSAHALRLLDGRGTRAALEVLERIETRPVTASAASGLNTLGTLSLLMALIESKADEAARAEWIQRGLRAKARLVGLLPEPDLVRFCGTVGDALAARDLIGVVEGFGESLKRSIEEARRYAVPVPAHAVVEALNAGRPRLDPIRSALGSTAREEIQRAIRICGAASRRDPSAANEAARRLHGLLQAQLPALAEATSKDDYLYRSVADAGAEALVSATTEYFNHHVEHGGVTLELIRELLPIGEFAAEIACGDAARKRARDDVAALRRMEDQEREQLRFGPAFAAVTAWQAACDNVWQDEDAAPSKVHRFVRASLSRKQEPGISIVTALQLLNAANSPLRNDIDTEESDRVLALNSQVCHRLLTLTVRAYNASGGRYGGLTLMRKMRRTFVSATNVPADGSFSLPVDDSCIERLTQNAKIAASNLRRASGCVGAVATVLLLFVILLVIPAVAGANPPLSDTVRPPQPMQDRQVQREGRMSELQEAVAVLSAQVRSLQANQEGGAARVGRLESAQQEAEQARRDLAARTEESDRAQERRATAMQRELSALDRRATEDRERLASETQDRVASDRRVAWYAGAALALIGLVVGLLWRWSHRRAGSLRRKVDGAAERLQKALVESGESSAKILATLDEVASRMNSRPDPVAVSEDPDHRLVLLMCDEINRLENNLRHMDPSLRAHRKLRGVARRMKENLAVRDYRITEMHGQRYDAGLTVIAEDWIMDDNLEPGQEVISWVKKPEVRYRGKIVQAANVQVATSV